MDLHTHCGYQSMLDEAVAIVLSPSRTPRHGVFRLSHPDPPGLRELQRCRKHGFHPDHQRNGQDAGNGVYEHSTHIRWTQTPIQVVDLRKPK
jgi:STAM-binding protein